MAAHSTSTANLVGQAEQDEGAGVLRQRQHLEGHLAQDRERAPAAREAAAQVVAGDVLHHAAAGLEDLAAAVHGAHAEQVVARRAGADRAARRTCWWRTRRRWWPGPPRRPRSGPSSIGSKASIWPRSASIVLDLRQGRAGAGRHDHLGRLVQRDAAHGLGRHVGGGLHRPADPLLGAGARHLERRAGRRRLGEHARELALVDGAHVG